MLMIRNEFSDDGWFYQLLGSKKCKETHHFYFILRGKKLIIKCTKVVLGMLDLDSDERCWPSCQEAMLDW